MVKLLAPAVALPAPLVLGTDERRAVEACEGCEVMVVEGIGCGSDGGCLADKDEGVEVEVVASPACREEADSAVTAAFCATLAELLLSLARNLLAGAKVALGEGVV